MKDNKKKNVILTSAFSRDKLKLKREHTYTSRKSLLMDSTTKLIHETSSIVKSPEGKKEEGSEVRENAEEKKSIVTINLNNTNNETILTDGLKTTQIKVVARFRPVNFVEDTLSKKAEGKLCVDFLNKETVSIYTTTSKNEFVMDAVFACNSSQKEVYKEVVESSIDDVLNGYNGTIFTYGQSGSGKTFTMFGLDIWDDEKKGIIPRSIDQIFNFINDEKIEGKFELNFSIIEIYKENLYDLLNPNTKSTDIKIKEDPKKGVYVHNITSATIEDKNEFFILLEEAEDNRAVGETRLNKQSSRSHIVFMLTIKQILNDCEKTGTLNLVDLAGSEKVSKTGAIGETLEEAKKINMSLSCLGNVINSLASGNTEFVPYRESKLTRILKDSLGGNYKTTLIVTCSPHSYNVDETISTLNFAKRAKNIKNKIKINLKKSPEEYERIIANLQEKLRLEIFKNGQFATISSVQILRSNTTFEDVSNCHKSCEEMIKIKDDEISKLKEEIDNIKCENKQLKDEILIQQSRFKINETILNLENSIKTILSNLDSSLLNFTQKDNINIKRFNESILQKELNKVKDILNYDLKLNEKLGIFDQTFEKFLENLRSDLGESKLIKSYETMNKYGKYVYRILKKFVNELMEDFLRKTEMFNTSKLTNKDKILVDKEKYISLKNSYLQGNALIIYYEILINEFFDKFSFDLKRCDKILKFYDYHTQLESFGSFFRKYLEILEEIRNVQMVPTVNPSFIYNNNSIINYEEEDRKENNKFIKHVNRKVSNFITGKNLITNIINQKLIDNKLSIINSDITPNDSLVINEYLNFRKKAAESVNSSRGESKYEISESSKVNQVQNIKINSPLQSKYGNAKEYEIKEKYTNNNLNSIMPIKRSTVSLSHFLKAFRNPRTGFIIRDQINPVVPANQDISELRTLRKEKELNKEIINTLLDDNLKKSEKIKEYEMIFNDINEKFKLIIKKEAENVNTNINILKEFYLQELEHAKSVIEELSSTIDDMLLNNKMIDKNTQSSKLLKELYREKKTNIMFKENFKSKNLNMLAEAIISDSGTATKKLDYVLLDIQKSETENEGINIVYGSGIDKKIPSKCPLYRNLKYSLKGDNASGMQTPSNW